MGALADGPLLRNQQCAESQLLRGQHLFPKTRFKDLKEP